VSISLTVTTDVFKVDGLFRISRGARSKARVLTVEVSDGEHKGRGECVPYARYDETIESVRQQIQSLAMMLGTGLDRNGLQEALTAGAARNAIDCALWDLEAKKAGKRVWELIGYAEPNLLTTAFTLSLDTPSAMEIKARDHAFRPLLKLKLAGPDDLARVEAVRRGAPDSKLIVDANEGWSLDDYLRIEPDLAALGVIAVEQPIHADEDECLKGLDHTIPLIADESCHTSHGYAALKDRYDMINIKLDKTGGLTEALKLQQMAAADDMPIMVGCIVGSSLAMAPAMVLAIGATIIDLDGPLLLAEDRDHPIEFDGSIMSAPPPNLWG